MCLRVSAVAVNTLFDTTYAVLLRRGRQSLPLGLGNLLPALLLRLAPSLTASCCLRDVLVILLSNAALWPLLAVITVAGISFSTAVSPGSNSVDFLMNHAIHLCIGLMLAQVDLRTAAVHQL